LARQGWQVELLEVDAGGRVDHAHVDAAIAPANCRLLSMMAVNNETGVRHDLVAIGELAHKHGVLYHCDATQLAGRRALDWADWPVDLLSLSGHKLGAPAGVGALIVRRGTPFQAPLAGHQEQGLRSGTENVAGIVGLGAAAAVAGARIAAADRVRGLRDRLWQGIHETIADVHRNGDVAPDRESGHVLNLCVDGAPGELVAMGLDLENVAVSTGSACTSGTLEPSHVLLAMGDDSERWRTRCRTAIRLSLGPENTADDVARVLQVLPLVVLRVRDAS
jgi:cysteine desulfurase